MPAAKLTITFTDGRTFQAKMTPKALVLAERHFGANIPNIEGSLYAAWVQDAPGISFDDWLDTIESAEEEGTTADPQEAAPSPVSPDSPSPQD